MTIDNTHRGYLVKNDRKQSDKSADFRGAISIGNDEFWLNAWVSTSKTGGKYLSLSARPKTESKNDAPKAESKKIDFDDGIPW